MEIEKTQRLKSKYNVFNYKDLAKAIAEIKETHFKNTNSFNIEVFYLKRISKERIIINLIINGNSLVIYYELFFTKQDLRKQHRQDIPGILIDELAETFKPMKSLSFNSDNLNKSGNYTMKYLSQNDLSGLQLNNYIISLENFKNNKDYISKVSQKASSLVLTFHISTLEDNLSLLLGNLVSPSCRDIVLYVYYDGDIDLNKLVLLDEKKQVFKLNELKVYLVNTNLESKRLLTEPELYVIPLMFTSCFLPEYLEVNYIDIMNSDNSKLEKGVSLFKYTKFTYTKRLFVLLNSLKLSFNRKNTVNLTYNILKSIVKFADIEDKQFEVKTNYLQLVLPKDKVKPFKFIFNLLQDYESILVRKTKYEELFKMVTTKPTDDDQIINKIRLKENDLGTVSKILTRIEGNTLLFLQNGTMLSIGGNFKLIYSGNEYKVALNTIIEIDRSFSNLKIITHSDKYFLSHFNAAGEIYKGKILIVGGMSIAELLPNFASTPIYLIDTTKYTVERVMPGGKTSPGVVFSHVLDITDNGFKVSEGFLLANYSGGINILNKQPEEVKIVKNEKVFIFDFNKNDWIN
jgi:hypothetical protein